VLIGKTFYLVVFFTVIGSLTIPNAMAERTTNVLISDGSSLGQLCVAARNCFAPSVLHIGVGTTVLWKNVDKYSHTVTSGSPFDNHAGKVFDSGLILPGKEFEYAFNSAGTYHYFCEIHPWMKGEIIVA